jgi:uncharacterized protein YbjT (DUF2867 family)
VGVATLKSLSSKYAGRVEIRAGVRNPEKAEQIKSLAGVTVVKAAMGGEGLEDILKGVHALLINTPGAQNRAELTLATAKAAKRAGVKHQVIISVLMADSIDTGIPASRPFVKIEREIKALDVAYTFLRLPFFVENYWGFKDTIKGAGAIYTPVDPTKTFSPVVVGDVGNAAAAVLVEPAKHTNQTYNVISDRHTYNEVATAFSEALGKTVTYTRVSYDDAKKAFLGMGIPEWQADGGIELFKLMNEEDPIISTENVGDYQKITGEQPTNLKAWVAQVKGAFE